MITNNRLDKPFGPMGTSAGIFMLIAGVIATYFSLTGLILVLIGAFIGFTSTSTLIDTDKKRIKFSNNLFGIFPAGQWIDIKPDMKVGLKNIHRGYRTYSRGNRVLDVHSKDIRIMLYGADNKQIMPIRKFDSLDSAKTELESLSNQFGLGLK
ncbi:MAG: hypothetical protein IMY71_09420 [Bacteroidetes bacterium]|nr:hypothetical protein [Bacteroidota bacterium]